MVILFDEIDELVLDRSSKRHKDQETVFKFMTPGMLTKLNNLRRAERSIFIIATNFAYRIDPAIRRTGRIDQNYLLLPPDAASRQRMLAGFLSDAIQRGRLQRDDRLDPVCIDWNMRWERLQSSSLFLGYKDMQSAVDRVVHRGSPIEIEDLERELRDWGRTTTLRLYNHAFDETEDLNAIKSEFLPLVEMATREGEELADSPWLDNSPLFTSHAKASETPFASKSDLKNKALDFVRNCSREYDRQ